MSNNQRVPIENGDYPCHVCGRYRLYVQLQVIVRGGAATSIFMICRQRASIHCFHTYLHACIYIYIHTGFHDVYRYYTSCTRNIHAYVYTHLHTHNVCIAIYIHINIHVHTFIDRWIDIFFTQRYTKYIYLYLNISIYIYKYIYI